MGMQEIKEMTDRLTPAAKAVMRGEAWPDRLSDCERVEKQLTGSKPGDGFIQGDYTFSAPLQHWHYNALGNVIRTRLQQKARNRRRRQREVK